MRHNEVSFPDPLMERAMAATVLSPRNKVTSLQIVFNALLLFFGCFTILYGSYILDKVHSMNPTGVSAQSSRPTNSVAVIAHAVSLITCQKETRVRGFLDALVILRHSIHRNSIHTPGSGSRYGYQMYAIIHPDGGCTPHIPVLKRLGYIPIVRGTPVNISTITNEWYRTHVEGENCCGSKEFIKLYAYTFTQHPVVVHWDLDVVVLKPLDDLYDSIIHDKDSNQGLAARQRLQLQRPSVPLPDRIDAFFTRDVTSSRPWEKVQAVQGGFLVARPSFDSFQKYQNFIQEANYTPGRGSTSGWGGMVRHLPF